MEMRKYGISKFIVSAMLLAIIVICGTVLLKMKDKKQTEMEFTYNPRLFPSPAQISVRYDGVEKDIPLDSKAAKTLFIKIDDAFGNAYAVHSTNKQGTGPLQNNDSSNYIRLDFNPYNPRFSYFLQDMDDGSGWYDISCSSMIFRVDLDEHLIRVEMKDPVLYNGNGKFYDEPKQLDELSIYLSGYSFKNMLEALGYGVR
jgi:hypothetical protein